MSQSELQTLVDSKVKDAVGDLDKTTEDIIRTVQIVSYQVILQVLVDEARQYHGDMTQDMDSCEALETAGMTPEAFLLYGKAMELRGRILQSRHVADLVQEWIRSARTAELSQAFIAAQEMMAIRDEAVGLVIKQQS
jgi:hypothetical protein